MDHECPNCKHKDKIEVEIHRRPQKVRIEEQEVTPDVRSIVREELQKSKPEKEERKEPAAKPQKELVIEQWRPGYYCKDCNSPHKNKNYRTRPKGKCTTCEQWAGVSEGKCPNCQDGELEPIDDDYLDDLGVPKPSMTEAEHEH